MKHINLRDTNNNSRKGDFAEYYAVTWLWDNGYEVFKNCGCTGLVDLIAVNKHGKVTFIDVKTRSGRSGRTRTEEQLKLDVKILNFLPDTRELRFVEHKT